MLVLDQYQYQSKILSRSESMFGWNAHGWITHAYKCDL